MTEKRVKVPTRALTKDELQIVRDYFSSLRAGLVRFVEVNRLYLLFKRDELFFEFGVRLGFRLNELTSIKWSQVYDFEKDCVRKEITIHKTNMKGKKKSRVCVISKKLEEYIADFKADWYSVYLRDLTPDDYLFQGIRSKKNTRIHNCTLHKRLCAMFKELDFEDQEKLSAHALRKTFCTRVYYDVVDKDIIACAQITGHSSPANLMYYINPDKQKFDDKMRDM